VIFFAGYLLALLAPRWRYSFQEWWWGPVYKQIGTSDMRLSQLGVLGCDAVWSRRQLLSILGTCSYKTLVLSTRLHGVTSQKALIINTYLIQLWLDPCCVEVRAFTCPYELRYSDGKVTTQSSAVHVGSWRCDWTNLRAGCCLIGVIIWLKKEAI
jgi:hypothetical protein